jgi:hypothetical protein
MSIFIILTYFHPNACFLMQSKWLCHELPYCLSLSKQCRKIACDGNYLAPYGKMMQIS